MTTPTTEASSNNNVISSEEFIGTCVLARQRKPSRGERRGTRLVGRGTQRLGMGGPGAANKRLCYTPRMIAKINGDRALALARNVLDIEADAVRAASRSARRRLRRRGRFHSGLQWAGGRVRHRQIRPYRPQAGRHARQHRHARLLRPSCRSQSRRPRHGHRRRRLHCDVEFRRIRRTDCDPAADQAPRRKADRGHRAPPVRVLRSSPTCI